MKARRVFLASGETILTELHQGRCWASEEVDGVEVEVPHGTICDICEEPIREIPDGMVRADGDVLFTFKEAHQALDIGLISEVECECDTCPRECPNWSPEEDPLEIDFDFDFDHEELVQEPVDPEEPGGATERNTVKVEEGAAQTCRTCGGSDWPEKLTDHGECRKCSFERLSKEPQPADPPRAQIVDLMEALKASLAAHQPKRKESSE